ncbi:hypothetical protein PUN28_013790 [Cardiocondyla obscurior]
MELINKYGYNGEMHKVTTSDGYILQLHRITGRANSTDTNVKKPVAFVMHGLLCDSSVWVISGRNKSLAFILADEGYDVWLGNARGNPYAHTHTSRRIKPKDYWNFSWNEIGTRDLPAMIDEVVKTTGQKKMFYLGHSQGTTAFFVMATERPQYQEYIEEMYAMAPIAYCGRMKSPFLQLLAQFTHSLEALLPVILGHVPASTAVKQMIHYGQLIKSGTFLLPGKFKHYDLGIISNKDAYGAFNPPTYDVSKIKAPVHLYYSENDWLANVKDVEKLYGELGNPSGKTLIEDKKFNHVDYMWARDVKTLVYDQIINQMKQRPLK